MKKLVLRAVFLVGIVTLFALPAFAIDYPSACKSCWVRYEDDMIMACDTPEDNTWGYEECTVTVVNNRARCRVSGAMCYYFEVQG
jgi:hypothetical protein